MDFNLSELTAPQQHRYFALKAIYGSEDAFKVAKVLHAEAVTVLSLL